jgi:hypothetical protein
MNTEGVRPSAPAGSRVGGNPIKRVGGNPMRAPRLAALLTACILASAAGVAGCGSTHGVATNPTAQKLQREDLVAVSHGLRQAEDSAAREMAAARIAWPLVANGLPASIPPATRTALSTAGAAARAIVRPPLMSKPRARSLTGPAAGIAGLFQSFSGLTERGWTLTGAAANEAATGPPAAARFARENAALYIDAVYDGHFDGSLIGKSLLAGYTSLGGAPAFGGTLSEAEVRALARAYSPAAEQLHPHPGVKLGT